MKLNSNLVLFAVCLFAVVAVTHSKLKPKPASTYFTICHRGDRAKLNACIKDTVMEARAILKNGIPALGLVPLEPLVIPRLQLNQGTGTFALKTTLTNFTFHKLSTHVVTRADLNYDDEIFTFDLDMLTPKVESTANYDIDGQILVLPIRGQGFCEMNFTDLLTKVHSEGKYVTRNGKKHVQLHTVQWDISANYKESRSWFHNLFNGDKRLGDATNNFLNSNQEEAFQAIKHLPQEAFGEVFRDLAQKVYDAYSFDELFPLK